MGMLFGLLNLLVGVFCDVALQATSQDRTNQLDQQLEMWASFENTIRDIFFQSDKEGTGEINKEDFLAVLSDPEIITQLQVLSIDAFQAAAMFDLIDTDCNG